MSRIANIVIITVLLCTSISAQAIEHDNKTWGGTTIKISPRSTPLHFNLFSQVRVDNNGPRAELLIFRPIVGFELSHELLLWFGYDIRPIWPDSNEPSLSEQRLWPQLVYKTKLTECLSFLSRTRYEFRWQSLSNQRADRFRQRAQLGYSMPTSHWSLKAYDELILKVKNADWISDERIDQNRIYLSVDYALNPQVSLEIGYMNIYRPRSSGDRMAHVAVLELDYELLCD